MALIKELVLVTPVRVVLYGYSIYGNCCSTLEANPDLTLRSKGNLAGYSIEREISMTILMLPTTPFFETNLIIYGYGQADPLVFVEIAEK